MVAFGGSLGSGMRYLVTQWSEQYYASSWQATLTVNVVGSFVAGILFAWHLGKSPELYLTSYYFFELGFLGGLTTFSSFIYEVLKRPVFAIKFALFYSLASLTLSLSVAAVGVWLGHFL